MKENKKRITFWFIVMFFFLIMFFLGKSFFKDGYGKYGAMKKILEPIKTEFNTSDEVKRLTDIRADIVKDKLVVTYKNANGKKEKYIYEYIDEDGIQYLKNKDEYGTNTWTFIAQQMTNSVYHLNGGRGSIFALYDLKIFSETTIKDGLVYNDTSKEIMINLKANIAHNISGKYKTLYDDAYIKEEDINNIATELETNNIFKYNNQDVKIYVKNTNNSYEIYAALTDINLYRTNLSVANIIKVLKPSVYETLNISDSNIIFESNTKDYTTQYNVVFSEAGIFETTDKIFQLNLFK